MAQVANAAADSASKLFSLAARARVRPVLRGHTRTPARARYKAIQASPMERADSAEPHAPYRPEIMEVWPATGGTAATASVSIPVHAIVAGAARTAVCSGGVISAAARLFLAQARFLAARRAKRCACSSKLGRRGAAACNGGPYAF